MTTRTVVYDSGMLVALLHGKPAAVVNVSQQVGARILDVRDGVAKITINRPEVRNAFDETLIAELTGAFSEVAADPETRVVLVRGEGRAFSAGGSFDVLARHAVLGEAWERAFAYLLYPSAETLTADAAARLSTLSDNTELGSGFKIGVSLFNNMAAFGDDTTALIMYDTETMPVTSAPGAECLTVSDGKITFSRFIFDRAPFDAARQAAT